MPSSTGVVSLPTQVRQLGRRPDAEVGRSRPRLVQHDRDRLTVGELVIDHLAEPLAELGLGQS